MRRLVTAGVGVALIGSALVAGVGAAEGDGRAAPAATQPNVIWVDPVRGADRAAGTRTSPVRTVTEAWRRIPSGTPLARPFVLQLRRGVHRVTPNYWENRWGTSTTPVLLNAVDGVGSARFTADINAYGLRHVTFKGLRIVRAGDVFHCERCSYVSLERVHFDGMGAAHETIKANQSDHLTIRNSTVAGAYENAIDFVAVRHATISGNEIRAAQDWCAYVKGGSAYVMVQRNWIHHCGTGGFTAGQGTGFEYMVPPWLRYEAYGVTAVDNVITDTAGAGLGVNGGYNIVYAFNTMFRVGRRSHTLEFVHGSRSCDGDRGACRANRRRGGWGGVGIDGQYIPNKHVCVVDNVVYNPPGYRSQWQHIQLAGPVRPPAGSGVPSPARADVDLVLAGNVIRNGGADMPSGLPDDRVFRARNWVNTLSPDFVDPGRGDFRPLPGGGLAGLAGVPIPPRTWGDAGVPGMPDPVIRTDRPPGANRSVGS